MQKHKVVYGEDGSVFGQCQYCVVHITRDMKQPFFETSQKNQVEQNGENTLAGERHFNFFDVIKTSMFCCLGQYIKHLFNAEKGGIAFAVDEG